MGLWRLLGREVNWERVARMQNKAHLIEINSAIIDAVGAGSTHIALNIGSHVKNKGFIKKIKKYP